MSEEEKLQLENECLLKYSKAQMIQKYIDELEENCTLSDLWCKSQEENKRLNNIINELEEYIKWQRKCSLSLNNGFTVSRLDVVLNKLQELKGCDKE